MKRQRGLRGWCGLGLAVVAVAGGAYAAKRYAEQHMLAAVLGSGVHADAVQWHWRQSTGCAENVEIPLTYAKDGRDQSLQLYAPKLWFVVDQAAMLRKRFILPRMVIEDAIISSNCESMIAGEVVDIDFGTGVELPGVEIPSVEMPGAEMPNGGRSGVTEVDVAQIDVGRAGVNSGDAPIATQTRTSGRPLPWLDQLQGNCEGVLSDKAVNGRQVSIDADMLSERMQAYFAESRAQAQRLLSEARDNQQQLVNMDNVLRQPQLMDVGRRLEQINDQLIKLKIDIGHTGKVLDEEQSRVKSALLVERKQLNQLADEYRAATGREVAVEILTQLLRDQLNQPRRAVVLMADIMRRPMERQGTTRGQQMRLADSSQPELAANSVSISGKMEIEGRAWPFTSQGKFAVMPADAVRPADSASAQDSSSSGASAPRGSSQWQMSIQTERQNWQLAGELAGRDEVCTILLTDKDMTLRVNCQVDKTHVSGVGQMALRDFMSDAERVSKLIKSMAADYRAEPMLARLMNEAMSIDEHTPERVEFTAAELGQSSDCVVSGDAIDWLGGRLSQAATGCMANCYRQAAVQLESVIARKLVDQKNMAATLRKDSEQFIAAQQDELRRIQATVNSLIEQRQTSYHFARQPGEQSR